jgi:hypothetical protein
LSAAWVINLDKREKTAIIKAKFANALKKKSQLLRPEREGDGESPLAADWWAASELPEKSGRALPLQSG